MNTFIIVLVVILVLIYICHKTFYGERFENTDKNMKLFVFVSSHCPHCITYLNKYDSDVSTFVKSKGIDFQKVVSDGSKESTDLFNKYDVQFVPAAILVKNGKIYKNIGSNITPQSIKSALEN